MRASRMRLHGWAALILWSLSLSVALADAPPIRATIDPAEISLGESAELTITTSGVNAPSINLPAVPGLNFGVVGQSRQMQMINGATMSSTSIIVRVTPQSAGVFTIPGFTPKSQPLVLRVNPDNGANNGPMQYGSGPLLPNNPAPLGHNPVTPNGSGGAMRLTPDGSAFARFIIPKHEVFVGESVPVDIQIGLRQGFVNSINGLPALKGGEFSLNNLSRDPDKTERLIDGQPFTILTWHSTLAPVKPGVSTLTIDTPLSVRMRTRPQRDSRMDDLLGDPFMQNFFGQVVVRDITVTSPPVEFKVLPVPTEGRPPGYNGAVGTFKVSSDLSSTTAAAGDPLTLKLHVSGNGNFDRVDSNMIDHLDEWKTYPPKASFHGVDGNGFKGEKIFEQPLIAAHPGSQTLPALSFTYFDPNTRRFESVRTEPIKVTITGSEAPAPVVANGSPGRANGGTGAASADAPGLDSDHAAGGARSRASLDLPYTRATYLGGLSALLIACAGTFVVLRRRERRMTLQHQRERDAARAIAAALAGMEHTAAAGDSLGFFSAARTALQQSLGLRWGIAPESITPTELDERFIGDGAIIREIFALADEANFSGDAVRAADFAHWSRIVRDTVSERAPA